MSAAPSSANRGAEWRRDPRRLRALFAIDLRSLALFRIGLALLVSFDLATRARFLALHYTDQGLVPRFLITDLTARSPLAFHFVSGSVAWEAFLFALTAVFSVMLLVGFRTRIATACLWALWLSLYQRNPLVLNGGDALVVLLLFWSMFLPIGARWSVDAGRGRDAVVAGPASAALLLQLALLYVSAGLAKHSASWWDGTALSQALGQQEWVRPAGEWLRQRETLTHFLTHASHAFEVFAPLLLFSPAATGSLRLAAIPLFLGFQFGLGLCLDLGLFPWYSSVGLAAFVPTGFWETLRRAGPVSRDPPGGDALPAGIAARGRHARFGDAIVVAAFVLGLAACAAAQFARELPAPFAQLAKLLALEQRWMMYGTTFDVDIRPRTRGFLADGSMLDFATDHDGPSLEPVRALLSDYRGRSYLGRFWGLETVHQQWFAHWLCRSWNGAAPGRPRLNRVEIDLGSTRLLPRGGRTPTSYEPLHHHECPAS